MRAIWGTLSPCSAESKSIWARVRSRGALVVRYSRSSCTLCVDVNGGIWIGLIPPGYHHSSTLSWVYLGMVIPVWFPPTVTDGRVRENLLATLRGCEHYLPWEHVVLVVDGDA